MVHLFKRAGTSIASLVVCAIFCVLLWWWKHPQSHFAQQPKCHGDPSRRRSDQEYYFSLFHEWMVTFNKRYAEQSELEKRFEIWLDRHFFMEQHNHQYPAPSYLLGHNQFSDLSLHEIHQLYHLGSYSNRMDHARLQHNKEISNNLNTTTLASKTTRRLQELVTDRPVLLPNQVDWRPAFGPARFQGLCGSCWAFAATGAIEGAYYIQNGGATIQLSEQQLVDCDKTSDGCRGGWFEKAFTYDTMGLCSLQDYPYVGWRGHGYCQVNQSCLPQPNTAVLSYVEVDPTVDALLHAVAIQPVAVSIQANQASFLFYHSGVFDGPCGEKTDHAALVVGYGTTLDGHDYWLVRNSFGTRWGEDGYIRIARNSTQTFGLCGILSRSSRPQLLAI